MRIDGYRAPFRMVVQTERDNDMFMVMLARASEQVKDLGSLDLPTPPDHEHTPLRPRPEDEQATCQVWRETEMRAGILPLLMKGKVWRAG